MSGRSPWHSAFLGGCYTFHKLQASVSVRTLPNMGVCLFSSQIFTD